MSGIAGIVNLDGEAVQPDLMWQLTRGLEFRGPDAQEIWTDGEVGLGHTMLRTTFEAESEKQPITLDGKYWLTCDARLDGRDELIARLNNRTAANPDDAELILFAYAEWGEDCVQHLIGDFCFALWDVHQRRLFCARDHLGVRQFYYAKVRETFVFSNTLECLRLHPQVSSTLNEVALGDFLLFGLNQDERSTIFADICRLPAAHSLTLSAKGIELKKYWTPRVHSIRFKKPDEYTAQFKELLSKAVSDRMRCPSLGLTLSGGLDSASVAAFARQASQQQKSPTEINAYCIVYDSAFADDERKYAALVANALEIPIEFLDGNDLNQRHNLRTMGRAPEPFNVDPVYVAPDELLSLISTRSRVALTGWDGDTFLNESPKHQFADLLKSGKWLRLLAAMSRYTYKRQQLPPIGVRTAWQRIKHHKNAHGPYPDWINKEFSAKLNLPERWREINEQKVTPHPTRPRAFNILGSASWSSLFARYDAEATLLPLEVRHPLIDLRVIEYLLAIPIIPWLLDKAILRDITTGLLPDEVRWRPKTILAGDPGLQLKLSKKFHDIESFTPVPELLEYVDRESIPRLASEVDSNKLWMNVRPYSLNQWFKNSL